MGIVILHKECQQVATPHDTLFQHILLLGEIPSWPHYLIWVHSISRASMGFHQLKSMLESEC